MKWLIVLLFLVGCTPKIVYVAAECPVPANLPVSPNYTTNDLEESASFKETMEAYVLDLEACQSHSEQLENLLNVYGAEYKSYKIRYINRPK